MKGFLRSKTLEQVHKLLVQGRITKADAEAYVREWNKGPHFTRAKVMGYGIINVLDNRGR